MKWVGDQLPTMELDIGRNGAIVLLVVFALLAIEDVLIFLNEGTVPGLEFFAASLVVLAVLAYVIKASLEHYPGD